MAVCTLSTLNSTNPFLPLDYNNFNYYSHKEKNKTEIGASKAGIIPGVGPPKKYTTLYGYCSILKRDK